MKSRDIVRSDKFKRLFPEIKIRKDMDNKGRWQNTEGGERFATSVGGTVTGFHAHLIIVDDPLNPKRAASDVERATANRFMDTTLSTRKVNKQVTYTCLVMQRLHEDDCTGHLLDTRKDIAHICLPAEENHNINPPELRDKYIDGLMDTQRMPRVVLNEMRRTLGSYGYAGQMAQSPAPIEGGIWRAWLLPYDVEPEKLTNIATDWDLAYTKNEKNSASAYVTTAMHDGKLYILDAGYEYLEFPDLIEYMKAKEAPHYIELKASGLSARQTLVQNGIPAIGVDVTDGDKIARTNLATPYAESGMVYCRRDLIDFILNDHRQGLLKFPNTGTDLNDAFVQAIIRNLKKPTLKLRRSKVY